MGCLALSPMGGPFQIEPMQSDDQGAVVELVAELDRLQNALYPPEWNQLVPVEKLLAEGHLILVARDADGRVVGTGALYAGQPGWAEIKRIYVPMEHRRQGIAWALLQALEAAARERGFDLLRLETGDRQPEANALYAAAGFRPCDCFSPYADHPGSLFWEKVLDS